MVTGQHLLSPCNRVRGKVVNWIKNNWVIMLAVLAALTAGGGYFMRKTLYRTVWQPLMFKLESLINYVHSGVVDGE